MCLIPAFSMMGYYTGRALNWQYIVFFLSCIHSGQCYNQVFGEGEDMGHVSLKYRKSIGDIPSRIYSNIF